MNSETEKFTMFIIIIPVIHSFEDAEKCLTSLDNLDYPKDRFKVVLIDCQILPGLQTFFEGKINKFGFRLTLLSLPERSEIVKSWLIEARINEARNYAIQKNPGNCYVFTEDDCSFEPDWLQKFESALAEEVGAIGGPDILPEGMGWFPNALDCVLNSFLGTAGMRKGGGRHSAQYYPRKENMAIPARILDRIGDFPEETPIGGEMDMAKRISDDGFKIKFLADNPVWHRRVTTVGNFLRLTSYMASMKVKLMRAQQRFYRSLHFVVFLAAILGILSLFLSTVSNFARIFVLVVLCAYLLALLYTVIASAIRKKNVLVGAGVLLLIPAHHFSLTVGIISGVFAKLKSS